MNNIQDLQIKELDTELIPPSTMNCQNPDQGGCKTVIIGKPGTGKTTLITSLLYEKHHIYPAAQVHSGTEDSNGHYRQLFPSTFVFNKFSEPAAEEIYQRQKYSKEAFTKSVGGITS